jgi:hypothetical protein
MEPHTQDISITQQKTKKKLKWKDNNTDDPRRLILFYIPPYNELLFRQKQNKQIKQKEEFTQASDDS